MKWKSIEISFPTQVGYNTNSYRFYEKTQQKNHYQQSQKGIDARRDTVIKIILRRHYHFILFFKYLNLKSLSNIYFT